MCIAAAGVEDRMHEAVLMLMRKRAADAVESENAWNIVHGGSHKLIMEHR